MTGKDIVKKAPNAIIILCATVLALAVLGSYVYLSASGKDATEISRFVNTLLNFAMLIIGGVGAVAAGAAASTSQQAKDAADKASESAGQAAAQTNGVLTDRLDRMEELMMRLNGDNPPEPPEPLRRE